MVSVWYVKVWRRIARLSLERCEKEVEKYRAEVMEEDIERDIEE